MADLLMKLRAMYSHRGDGMPTQLVNPNGPEAADRIEALEAQLVEAYERCAQVADAGATWGLAIAKAVHGEKHTYSVEKVRELFEAVASDIRSLTTEQTNG